MRIHTVLGQVVLKNNTLSISLCKECKGSGSVWSDLEFGDGAGDEELRTCYACKGSGRIKIVRVVADVVVPFDYEHQFANLTSSCTKPLSEIA